MTPIGSVAESLRQRLKQQRDSSGMDPYLAESLRQRVKRQRESSCIHPVFWSASSARLDSQKPESYITVYCNISEISNIRGGAGVSYEFIFVEGRGHRDCAGET